MDESYDLPVWTRQTVVSNGVVQSVKDTDQVQRPCNTKVREGRLTIPRKKTRSPWQEGLWGMVPVSYVKTVVVVERGDPI